MGPAVPGLGVKWRRNTLLGAGLAGAEGVWCHRSQAGSPLQALPIIVLRLVTLPAENRQMQRGNPTVRFGEDFKWVFSENKVEGRKKRRNFLWVRC